jgi:hypothetical protein
LCLNNSPSFCWREPDNPKQSAVESINKEIECDSFVKWIQAKSAQEHEEMGILEKVEAITAKHRQEDIERQEKWNWRNFRWMVIAVGAAIISAIAAIFPELLRSAK